MSVNAPFNSEWKNGEKWRKMEKNGERVEKKWRKVEKSGGHHAKRDILILAMCNLALSVSASCKSISLHLAVDSIRRSGDNGS